MGLKQNTTINAQSPLRQLGGGAISGSRSMWGRTDLRNSTVGQGIETELAGIPAGHYAPSSWNIPYRAGQISAFTFTGATVTPNPLNMSAGVNAQGDATFSFTVGPSQLNLIVSAIGSASITFSVSGSAAAVIQAVGGIGVNFVVGPASIGAESSVSGSTTITFSATVTPRGDGNMQGAITPYTELSPQTLAAAVWNALASAYTEAGSMGELMNTGASGLTAAQVWAYVNRSLTDTVSANVEYVNGVQVVGTGAPQDPWGPA